MTQKEKAKAYDKVREKIALRFGSNVAEEIFSEFEMSEDEKIRKGLIENFKWFCGDYPETSKWGKDDNLLVKDIIAWLEKQGQKSAWSEEDECMLNNVVDTLKPLSQTTHSGYSINNMIDWLKSIKPVKEETEWNEASIKPPFVKTEYGNLYSEPVLCRDKFGNYFIANYVQWRTGDYGWFSGDDEISITHWKELQ